MTEREVFKVLQNAPRKTSSGSDELSYIELIDGRESVAPILTEIINGIIRLGHWPSSWRTSIIKPLFKGGPDKQDPSKYRPISLTAAPSRLVEKILNGQLQEHFIENDLIPNECHGFVPGKGTTTAALDILTEMQHGVEDCKVPTLLGIDMSSAFDAVSRNKLLRLMSRLGVGALGLQLFESYFTGRMETVEVGGKRGSMKNSTVGVLQGSGLSPLFFLIYFL